MVIWGGVPVALIRKSVTYTRLFFRTGFELGFELKLITYIVTLVSVTFFALILSIQSEYIV